MAGGWRQGLFVPWMDELLPFSVSVVWFKGGPESAFLRSIVYLEKSIYPNLFISKLRKLNSIFFYYSTFYT